MRRALWLVAGLAAVAQAHAADPIQTYGIGSWGCATISSDNQFEKSVAMTYVSGYISGLNAQRAVSGQRQVAIANGTTFFIAMREECQAHVDESLLEASTMTYAAIIKAMPAVHKSNT